MILCSIIIYNIITLVSFYCYYRGATSATHPSTHLVPPPQRRCSCVGSASSTRRPRPCARAAARRRPGMRAYALSGKSFRPATRRRWPGMACITRRPYDNVLYACSTIPKITTSYLWYACMYGWPVWGNLLYHYRNHVGPRVCAAVLGGGGVAGHRRCGLAAPNAPRAGGCTRPENDVVFYDAPFSCTLTLTKKHHAR